jgi:2-haloacid dehalogenase
VDELAQVGPWRGAGVDSHEFVNEWRRRTMRGIVGRVRPAFHMDDVHLKTLDETVGHFGLPALPAAEREHLWRAWHRLRAWPDFPPALRQLRGRLPVVSFTMLPVPLVLDVSRANGLLVRRPLEWGPQGPPDPLPNRSYDFVVDDFGALAAAVLAEAA